MDQEWNKNTNLNPVRKGNSFLILRADQYEVPGCTISGIRLTETAKVSKTFSKEYIFTIAPEQQFSDCDQQTPGNYFLCVSEK